MDFRFVKKRLLLAAIGLAICGQSGCLWKREAAVSPQTIVSRQLCRQGITAMEQSQWDAAEPLLAKAVDVCPEDPDARQKYANLLWQRGRKAEAVEQMSEAIRLAPDDAEFRIKHGEMQLALGNLDAAGKAADWALDMDPKRPQAWALRGRLMRRAGQPRAALSDLHRAEGLAPENTEYQSEIAEVYLTLQQPDRALATLQSLSANWSTPDEPAYVLVLKGRAYAAMARHDAAANSFLLASNRGAQDSETYYRLADAQLQAGRPDEAIAAARRALAVDPRHAPSRHLLAQLGINPGIYRR